MRTSLQISHRLSLAALAGLLLLAGCADQSGQLATVQALADALRRRDLRAACDLNVPGQTDRINCDALLVPLLHYCPHFAGAKIQPRARNRTLRFASEATLPIRYLHPVGKGEVDVRLRRTPQGWRVVSLTPLRMESNQ